MIERMIEFIIATSPLLAVVAGWVMIESMGEE
jgi:hypothetical protein